MKISIPICGRRRGRWLGTHEAIDDDAANSYLPFTGQGALREDAAARVGRAAGVAYDAASECIVSAGGLAGIFNVLLSILEPGDEVVLTDPTYAGLINRVHLAAGVPRFARLQPRADGWRLDLDSLAAAIGPRTKALLIMSPSMPGGYVASQDRMASRLRNIAQRHGIWLVYDAAMERILFDGRDVIHPAGLPGMRERTITIGASFEGVSDDRMARRLDRRARIAHDRRTSRELVERGVSGWNREARRHGRAAGNRRWGGRCGRGMESAVATS